MKAFVFPGQGAQFVGMGKDLCLTVLMKISARPRLLSLPYSCIRSFLPSAWATSSSPK